MILINFNNFINETFDNIYFYFYTRALFCTRVFFRRVVSPFSVLVFLTAVT